MTINGKMSDISREDLIACGKTMDLKPAKCKKIVNEVAAAARQWEDMASSVGIPEQTIRLIQKELKKQPV